jgi:hypothetical protein
MTNIVSIRLANGTTHEWSVTSPSQEQITLLPIVIDALDRNNDSLVADVVPATVTDLAQTSDEDLSDNDILERLVDALVAEKNINAVIEWTDEDDLAYFGEGEIAVSICAGVAIPVFPSDLAEEKLESLDQWSLREDVVVQVNGKSIVLNASVSEAIAQYGDIEEVYNEVFDDYSDEWQVDGYTYDTSGFVVHKFSRGLSVADFTKSA